jgi:hypothetical protein
MVDFLQAAASVAGSRRWRRRRGRLAFGATQSKSGGPAFDSLQRLQSRKI